jgi:hypothetical protein
MTTYSSLEAFTAAAPATAIPADFVRALLPLTRRPVEVEADTIVAKFTTSRRLIVSREDDGAFSAWATADIVIGGNLVSMAVLIGNVYEAVKVPSALRKAKVLIAEVVASGSRAAPSLGDGVMPDGTKVYLYAAPGLDSGMSRDRLSSFVKRHSIEIAGSKKAPASKVRKTVAPEARV